MALDPLTSITSIRTELEAGWRLFDLIYDGLTPGQWARKFGKTWTFADQPHHLAYFDRMIAKGIEENESSPADRMHLRSMGDMNVWNNRELANRKPSHSVQDSLREMRASRDAIRRLTATMTDQDLDRKAWMPLIFGWTTVRGLLQAAIVHNVAEYWKLWLRTGQKTPAPSPAAVHHRLDFMMRFMPATLNREAAGRTPFTVTWNFDGPGGGMWTFHVRDGKCDVSEGPAGKADVVITMKPETFHKLVAKMTPAPLLMLTGQMKVKGLMKMGTFGKLFPEPKADQQIDPSRSAIAG